MKSKHFGAVILALIAALLCVFVSSCKGEVTPSAVYYTITYETAHGTAPESKKVLSGTILAIQDLPTLTAAGYTFEGWYIGSSKITPELNYTVNSNIKLTAKWTEVSATPPAPAPVYYTVTYVTERGQAPQSKSVLSGTALTAADLPDLTADGYAFEGWYIGTTKITGGYEVSGNITLTAKWRELPPAPVYYTVTYVTERGQAPQSKSVLSGTALTDADLLDLTAQGYAFEGWYIGSTKITADYKVTDNITLTALWKKLCTITYESDYDQAPPTKTVVYGTELKYSDLPDLLDADHEFTGWYFGSSKILSGYIVYTDMTLRAYWDDNEPEEVKYTVSYTNRFGNAPSSRQFVSGDVLLGGDLLTMYEEGYEFAGWYFGDIKMENNYPVIQDMELVAKWNYTITYSTEHGTTPQSVKVLEGTALSAEHLPTLSYTGYQFTNWSIESQPITAGYVVNDNITLTATWLKTYTLSYSTERGTTPDTITVLSGTTLASGDLPALTATGYTFDGWYSGNTKITEASNYKVNADTTLVGKWNYTISYSTAHGTTPTIKTVSSGYKLTQSDLPTLSDNSYIFIGWKIGDQTASVNYAVNDNITLTAVWADKPSGFSLLITSDTDITEDELNFELTAQKSGDSYILTATEGYDFYLWSVDDLYYNYFENELNNSYNQLSKGNVPAVFAANTLTFSESNLPEDVAADGTYVVYVQAFRKYRPEEYSSSYKYKRVGLVFTVIRM